MIQPAQTTHAIAHQHELLDALAWRRLGRSAGVVEATLTANPGLAAQGPELHAGQAITLVQPDTAPTRATIHLWD